VNNAKFSPVLPAQNTGEMPFLDHLRELRQRIIWAGVGILVSAVLCYSAVDALLTWLIHPFLVNFAEGELVGTGPADAFMMKLHLALASGCVLSAPWWVYQLWLFVSPGLNDKERRHAIPFVLGASAFFLLGVLFCFYLVIPIALQFFANEYVTTGGVKGMIDIRKYVSFVVTFCLVFGVVFELPIVTYFLARFEMVTSRFLIKNFRYAVLVIFVIAAILTPPDAVSQMLLAVPLLVHYGLCIGVTKFVEKQRSE
jgi:sec-independent protein translocase protein TatC